MGIIEKIVVSDETMQARERDALVARARAFRASLPRQTTDSLTLLREDRDR